MAKDQLLTPLEKLEALPDFEGNPTLAVSLEVRGIAGGFDDGLTIEPVVKHRGDRIFLLLEGTVDDILHKWIKEANGWRRAHVIRVENGVIVDQEFAAASLDEMSRRIEEARGLHRLPFGDELQDAHDAGEHADGLVENCPSCDREAEVAAAEAAGGEGDDPS